MKLNDTQNPGWFHDWSTHGRYFVCESTRLHACVPERQWFLGSWLVGGMVSEWAKGR